jgi:hypothetical protein
MVSPSPVAVAVAGEVALSVAVRRVRTARAVLAGRGSAGALLPGEISGAFASARHRGAGCRTAHHADSDVICGDTDSCDSSIRGVGRVRAGDIDFVDPQKLAQALTDNRAATGVQAKGDVADYLALKGVLSSAQFTLVASLQDAVWKKGVQRSLVNLEGQPVSTVYIQRLGNEDTLPWDRRDGGHNAVGWGIEIAHPSIPPLANCPRR